MSKAQSTTGREETTMGNKIRPQTAKDPDPSLIWVFGEWLLRWEANRANLSNSVVARRVYQIGFKISRRIQSDFEAAHPPQPQQL